MEYPVETLACAQVAAHAATSAVAKDAAVATTAGASTAGLPAGQAVAPQPPLPAGPPPSVPQLSPESQPVVRPLPPRAADVATTVQPPPAANPAEGGGASVVPRPSASAAASTPQSSGAATAATGGASGAGVGATVIVGEGAAVHPVGATPAVDAAATAAGGGGALAEGRGGASGGGALGGGALQAGAQKTTNLLPAAPEEQQQAPASTPVGAAAARRASIVVESSSASKSGEGGDMKVNQYHILRPLGSGAFAAVVCAEDTSSPELTKYVRCCCCCCCCWHCSRRCICLFCVCVCVRVCARECDTRPFSQAIKIFSKSALKKKRDFVKIGAQRKMITALDKAQKELAIMKKLDHENVIRCFEIIDDEEQDELYMGACGGLQRLFDRRAQHVMCRSFGAVQWWPADGLRQENWFVQHTANGTWRLR